MAAASTPSARRTKSKPRTAKRASSAARSAASSGGVTRPATRLLDGVHALNEDRGEARLRAYFIRTPAWKSIAKAPPEVQAAVFVLAARRLGAVRTGIK